MRRIIVGLVCGWIVMGGLKADPPIPTNASTASGDTTPPADPGAEARAKVPGLYQAWKIEHDPAKRADLADQLREAVVQCYVNRHIDIVDAVVRNDAPLNLISPPANVESVSLTPVSTFADLRPSEQDYPRSPVFRRVSAHRLEMWTSTEGWLFDDKGKLLHHVHVPRRDGTGREWFGAFLPNGTWITTDIWDGDRQINCYTSSGEWKWELTGVRMVAELPKPSPNEDRTNQLLPLIGWARSDKAGNRWIVSVGANGGGIPVLVDQSGHAHPLPSHANIWQMVYPRAMGVRGGYVAFDISSDDGQKSLGFETVAHGPYCDWPIFNYAGKNGRDKSIYEGTIDFGFWPHSHDVHIEVPARIPEPWHTARNTWFFDASGKYQGEVTGSYLADAANGRDLLLQDGSNRLVQVASGKSGLTIPGVRTFTWADGSQAVPVAIYDDLRLGFFLRGAGITGLTDDARLARIKAGIVLARW